MAVLDEHLPVAVEEDAARRAQRERPLVVVLRHLLELGVLHDLQEPEADAERGEHHDAAHLQDGQPDGDAAAIFGECHICESAVPPAYRFARFENLRRSIAPGSASTIVNAIMPTTAFPTD